MSDLTNKWALVTGASRGIGREIALFMAKQGVNVVVHSRELEHTSSIVKELEELGVQAFSVAAELSDEQQVKQMIAFVSSKVTIDILFNNAGVQPKKQTNYWGVAVDDYLSTYRVNVIAPMLLIEGFLPKMLEQNFGRIINTTSGIKNQPEQGA